MAGSNHERPFAPADLDVLEDALELPAGRDPAWPEAMDDVMRSQIQTALRSYRAIGVHARAALLAAEPPTHVLDAVIAQARAEIVRPAMPDAPVVAPPRRWWSSRVAWLVPTLGAAIAAVAVIVVMQPRGEAPTLATVSSDDRVAKAEQKAASSPSTPLIAMRDQESDKAEAGRGDGLVETVTATPAMPEAEDAAAREARSRLEVRSKSDEEASGYGRSSGGPTAGRRPAEDPPAPVAPPPAKKPTSSPGSMPGSAGGVGGNTTPNAPEPTPEAPADPKPKSEPKAPKPSTQPTDDDAEKKNPRKDAPPSLDDRLALADAARQRGDCGSARRDYDAVIASGSSRQRARARAGKALCLEQSGDESAARKLLDEARNDDPAVDAWVDTQR